VKNRPVDVLFICVHNSGRSQMAEAFFNLLAHGKYLAASAGTEPAAQIDSIVIRVMAEAGIDMQGRKPRPLTPEMAKEARLVITMGCGVSKSCPALFIPVEDWGLPDPKGMPVAGVRRLRDDIKSRVSKLIKRLDREFNMTLTQR
jgi:arsenate reductase (thioredoxin)